MTLKEILSMAQSDSAEASFVNSLNAGNEKVAEPVVSEKPEAEKIAEITAEAQIFAEEFIKHLDKIAAAKMEKMALNAPPFGITPITPDSSPVTQINPAIQTSVREDARGPEVDKVNAIITSLLQDITLPATKTYVGAKYPTVEPAAPTPVMGQQPTAMEVAQAQEEAAAVKEEMARKGAALDNSDVIAALYRDIFQN